MSLKRAWCQLAAAIGLVVQVTATADPPSSPRPGSTTMSLPLPRIVTRYAVGR